MERALGRATTRITDKHCVLNDTFQQKITSDNGQMGGLMWAELRNNPQGHAFSLSPGTWDVYVRCWL